MNNEYQVIVIFEDKQSPHMRYTQLIKYRAKHRLSIVEIAEHAHASAEGRDYSKDYVVVGVSDADGEPAEFGEETMNGSYIYNVKPDTIKQRYRKV